MKKGDTITIKIAGRQLTGVVELAGGDRPLAVLFDEGVPAPFGIYDGKQILLLLHKGDACHEIQGGRLVELL